MKPGKWIPKIVVAAFFIGALLYFTGYAVRTFRSEVTTTVIHATTVEDAVEGSGLAIRQEEPVEGSGELMEVLPAEGETVAKGETLALVYESKEALQEQAELDQKEAELEALQYVLSHSAESSATVELGRSIVANLESIRATVFQEDLSEVDELMQDLETMIYRQDYTYRGSEAVTQEMNGLSKEIKQLRKAQSSAVSQLKAKAAGTFSTMVDGYESVLTPEVLTGLTPSKLEALRKQQKKVDRDGYLGRIITSRRWYFAANMDQADTERMRKDQKVTVRFDDVAGDQAMTVDSISEAQDGKVTVVFSSTRRLGETSLLRSQNVSVIYDSYNGFRIPKEALRMEGDQYYIYRVGGAQIRRAQVEIVAETEDYFVVWQGESVDEDGNHVEQSELEKAKQIRDGDSIVVRGTDLYDGKVIRE